MHQPEINFETKSPINKIKLNRQNKCVANHLLEIGKLHRLDAFRLYGIGDLHSRIPETESYFKSVFGIDRIERRMIKVFGAWGESRCNEYWLTEGNKLKIKNIR